MIHYRLCTSLLQSETKGGHGHGHPSPHSEIWGADTSYAVRRAYFRLSGTKNVYFQACERFNPLTSGRFPSSGDVTALHYFLIKTFTVVTLGRD